MPLIVRLDVDRPYGKGNLLYQSMSKVGSDYYFPAIERLGYLRDLKTILHLLSEYQVQAYLFFRRCTLPTDSVMRLVQEGHHIAGLHLENSRSLATFREELVNLESHLGSKITVFTKHGSGVHQYGFRHYAPYEPEKYLEWGVTTGMKLFFGNLEDPRMTPYVYQDTLRVFPSAYWIEPEYRNTHLFTSAWLLREIEKRDVVLLLHPDDVTASDELMNELPLILRQAKTNHVLA